jgi:DNA-binding NarL/FixJ family response regulator
MEAPITIAYVEDNPTLRLLLGIHLNREGFKVGYEAGNGLELLEQLHKAPALPAACLLDMNMPVMDGFETVRHLRDKYPSIKILACSTDDYPNRVEEILGCGAHGFVSKDLDPVDIQNGLLTIIKGKPYILQHPTMIKSCGGRRASYPSA